MAGARKRNITIIRKDVVLFVVFTLLPFRRSAPGHADTYRLFESRHDSGRVINTTSATSAIIAGTLSMSLIAP